MQLTAEPKVLTNEVAGLAARSFASSEALRFRERLPGCTTTVVFSSIGAAHVLPALEVGETVTNDVRFTTTPHVRTISRNAWVAGIATHQDAGSPRGSDVPRVVTGNGDRVVDGAWFSPHERGNK